jgi:hypothetical protein
MGQAVSANYKDPTKVSWTDRREMIGYVRMLLEVRKNELQSLRAMRLKDLVRYCEEVVNKENVYIHAHLKKYVSSYSHNGLDASNKRFIKTNTLELYKNQAHMFCKYVSNISTENHPQEQIKEYIIQYLPQLINFHMHIITIFLKQLLDISVKRDTRSSNKRKRSATPRRRVDLSPRRSPTPRRKVDLSPRRSPTARRRLGLSSRKSPTARRIFGSFLTKSARTSRGLKEREEKEIIKRNKTIFIDRFGKKRYDRLIGNSKTKTEFEKLLKRRSEREFTRVIKSIFR